MIADAETTESAILRLTAGIEPVEHREILMRCLNGSVSPAVALMRLLIDTEDAGAVRTTVDEITMRAAVLSRAGDNLIRDRVDELTQLMVENELGCERIAEMLRTTMDSPEMAPTVEAGIAFCERLFDWSVQQSEEASVALYSLGNPTLLERATNEIIGQMEKWKVIARDRTVLDIGCGIGRIAAELGPRVRDVHGIDVSTGMINIALKRCEPLANVHLLKSSGHDLREFTDGSFDTVMAVDTFPYINQSGAALVESYFGEAARVLRPGGDFVIFNYSYRGDDDADRADVSRLAKDYGFDVEVSGDHPFAIWDGSAFHLRKRPSKAAK
ncbi:MAG: class I SAM-dependent methyltransferase [Gemmatimonadaceae bacterium]